MCNLNDKDLRFDLQLFGEEDPPADPPAGDFPEWMSQLPDEHKKDEYGKGYKTMGEFYKTHKGLRAKLDAVPHPPEKADGYEFPEPDEESGIKLDPGIVGKFRKVFFNEKLSKEQAKGIYESYSKIVSEQLQARGKAEVEAARKHDELMHGEWKEDFDNNMKLAEKGIKDVGGDDLETFLVEKGIRDNPMILKMFKQIGFEHSDDTIKDGSISGSKGERTLDDEYPSMKDLPDRR